jgi:hypothetical protein
MKKNLLIIVFLVFGFAAQAQFKLGINAGVPVGDVSDFYSFSAGADAYYMFGDPDKFFKVGATAGFINYFGKEADILGQTVKFDNTQFIPVGAAVRFTIFKFLTFGPDLGYGIGLDNEIDGGFYWRSVLGLDFANRLELNTFYHSVSVKESSFGSIGVGILLEF